LAYFVRTFDKVWGIWYDGLGRRLEETPIIARFIFGEDSEWVGWGYFLLDLAVFWGGVAIATGLIALAAKLGDVKNT